MKKIALALIISSSLFASCDSFMDIKPKGMLIPTDTKDFYDLMADPSHASGAYPLMDICCDNVELTTENINSALNSVSGKAYYFYDGFYTDVDNDQGWNKSYNIIYNCNIVMKYVPDSKNGTQAQKDMAMAEARVNRAYYYWYLNQTYGKAYDKATANKDLSVPLMLEPDLEAKPVRTTQDAVIAQILQDLEGVDKYLAVEHDNKYRATQSAANSLLARVYLYVGEYEKAATEASKALKLNNKLLDYRTFSFKNEARPFSGVNNKPDFIYSPEILFFRSNGFTNLNTSFALSKDLEQVYNEYPNDLRMKFNYSLFDRQGKPVKEGLRMALFGIDYTIGVPEMMLIIAENYARKGDTKALDVLNDLRKTRFLATDYTPLTGTTKEQLLNHVIKERRRELHMHGLRWFDMKRLAKEGLFTKTIVRTVQDIEHKLEPNSNRYVFPLAPSLLAINPRLEQNPR